jgi:branched-chain amino acid transport system ATP-binding protein
MDLLRVEDLKKRFGGLTAVDSISFTVEDGEIVGLIGPNGAGKSTTFNLVMGALPADEGTIEYDGERIDELSTDARVRRGLGRTYQTPKQFQEFSVRENVRACMLPNRFRGTGGDKSYADRAEEVLERVALADRATASPGKLTPGELRRLEIGKALATDPELLLLDEVFAGITTAEA